MSNLEPLLYEWDLWRSENVGGLKGNAFYVCEGKLWMLGLVGNSADGDETYLTGTVQNRSLKNNVFGLSEVVVSKIFTSS